MSKEGSFEYGAGRFRREEQGHELLALVGNQAWPVRTQTAVSFDGTDEIH